VVSRAQAQQNRERARVCEQKHYRGRDCHKHGRTKRFVSNKGCTQCARERAQSDEARRNKAARRKRRPRAVEGKRERS
jgi:hypothetical protein